MRKASLSKPADVPADAETDPTDVNRHPQRPRRIRWQACPSRPDAVETRPLSLSTRAIACLVQRMPRPRQHGRDGHVDDLFMFGGQLSPGKLLRIAAACSRAELLAMRGVGRFTVDEIAHWLEDHGSGFRPDADGLSAALGQAIGHLETLIETSDDVAYLQAFLALPGLKRALRAAPARRTALRSASRRPGAKSDPFDGRQDRTA